MRQVAQVEMEGMKIITQVARIRTTHGFKDQIVDVLIPENTPIHIDRTPKPTSFAPIQYKSPTRCPGCDRPLNGMELAHNCP